MQADAFSVVLDSMCGIWASVVDRDPVVVSVGSWLSSGDNNAGFIFVLVLFYILR